MRLLTLAHAALATLMLGGITENTDAQQMDDMWGEHIQNQQNASHNYQKFPIGWINFPKAGRHTVSVSCIEGDLAKASLKAVHFTFVD